MSESPFSPRDQTHFDGLRKQASRGGRALDGGAAFTPVRDNVLIALLDAYEKIRDEREMTAQAIGDLRLLEKDWPRMCDETNFDGEPLIVELLRSVIDDLGGNLIEDTAPVEPVRCSEFSEGHQCIHEDGHAGGHFAKSEHTYLLWGPG